MSKSFKLFDIPVYPPESEEWREIVDDGVINYLRFSSEKDLSESMNQLVKSYDEYFDGYNRSFRGEPILWIQHTRYGERMLYVGTKKGTKNIR